MYLHRLLPILIAAVSSVALASPTSPTLLIDEASVIELGGKRQLHLEGSFHYDDLVQVAYPFKLLVYTAAGEYACYDLSGGTATGQETYLVDGLDADEAPLLMPCPGKKAKVGVVSMAPNAIDFRLPDDLPHAPLTVQIFVEDQGRIVFSNARLVTEESVR